MFAIERLCVLLRGCVHYRETVFTIAKLYFAIERLCSREAVFTIVCKIVCACEIESVCESVNLYHYERERESE